MAVQKENRSTVVWLPISSFFIGLSWAALIPMWHTPDEQAHFAQAQDFAAIGHRPNPGKSTSRDIVLSEQLLGTFRDNGNNSFTYHPEYRLSYSDTVIGPHEEEIISLPMFFRADFLITEATGYPPLYYWYIAGINKLFWQFDLITRVFLSRTATVVLTTMAVFVSYLLSLEVLKKQFYAIATAALVSFHPMWRFVGSGVTSDALYNFLFPLGILVLIYSIRKTGKKWFWLFHVIFLGNILTKVQSIALYIFAFPTLLRSVVKKKHRVEFIFFCILLLLFGIVVATAIIRATPYAHGIPLPVWVTLPEISHLTQLYNSPAVQDYVGLVGRELYRQMFPWYWGGYRWLSLTLPLWVYRLIKIAMFFSLTGWIYAILTKKLKTIVRVSFVQIIAANNLLYTLGLFVWNFFFWKSHGFSFGIQGRYFFPNLPEHMILLLAGLLFLAPVVYRRFVAWLAALGMFLFHWYSLWFVSSSYYDISSFQTFFLQASQYKPWFFKIPFLPILIFLALLSSMIFFYKLLTYKEDSIEEQ